MALCAIAILGGAFSAGITAKAVPPQAIYRAQSVDDWRSIFAQDLLEKLHLTRQQGLNLLPVYERACRLYSDYYRRLRECNEGTLATYPAYRDQKRENVGITPDVEKSAVRAHAALKDLVIDFDGAIANLERNVFLEILTPAQKQVLKNYQPERRTVARESGAVDLRREHDQQRRDQLNPGRRTGRSNPAARAPARPGKHPDPRRRKTQQDPARSNPLTRQLTTLQRERERIDAFSHPRSGPFGRFILSPAAADLIYGGLGVPKPRAVIEAQTLWRFGERDYSAQERRADTERARRTKNEINDWNLINGLNLTIGQMTPLYRLAEAAERYRREQQANRAPQAWLDAKLVQLESAARRVLTPGQQQVIEKFSTCFKGKPDLRNPVRVGQADDKTNAEVWLERARRLSGENLERAVEHRLASEELRLIGPMNAKQKAQRRLLLLRTAVRAGQLSDLDFNLDKRKLADTIALESRSLVVSQQIDRINKTMNKPGKIARLMFNEPFANALAIRSQQLARAGRGTPIDRRALTAKANTLDQPCPSQRKDGKNGSPSSK